ncbi:phage tail tape measure protein, partial [Lactococcus sp. AK05]
LPSIIPVVKEIDNLAGSFSKLSPETQQFIIHMAIAAAAVAPTAKALSGLTSIISGVTGGLARFGARGAGKLALEGITTEAGLAAKAVGGSGGLAAELGGISPILAGISPIAVGALGTAGLAGLIIGVLDQVSKLEDKHNVFGTINVPDETYNKVKNFEEKVEGLKTATEKFGAIGPKAFNDVKQAIADMGTAANSDIDAATQKLINDAKILGWSDDQIKNLKQGGSKAKDVIKAATDDMTNIYQNAAKNHRQITADENSKIIADQNVIAGQELDALKITGSKKTAVMKALNGDMTNMSVETANNVSDSLTKLMDSENDSYKKKMAAAKELFENGKMSAQEYNETTEAYNNQHKQIMEKYGVDLAATQQVIIDNMQKGTQSYGAYMRRQSEQFANYGLDFEEMLKKAGSGAKNSTQELGDSSKLLAQYAKNMSSDVKKADDTWNSLVLDPKTGKVTTNAAQVVADTLKQKGGWEQIQFVMKHANLSTNAKASILEAVIASGQWDSLSPKDKELFIHNQQGLLAIAASQQKLNEWNSIPDEVKKLLGDNSGFINNEANASAILDAWNKATPEEKKLLAQNLTLKPKMDAQAIIDSLQGKTVPLGANNNTGQGVNSAAATIAALQGKTVGIDANDSGARKTLSGFLGDIPTSKTIDLIINKTNNAQGTPYHPGGLAMVNDQKGPTYKELISLPNGVSFIPEGRDVTMPLPKGTKILKASKTAQLIPKYADGTGGIPANAKIFRDMRAVQQHLVVNAPVVDNSKQLNAILSILETIASSGTNKDVINALQLLSNRPAVSVFDKNDAARTLTPLITKQQSIDKSIKDIINGRRR